MTKCPQSKCNMVVPHSFFLKYLKGAVEKNELGQEVNYLNVYLKWHCKQMVDANKNMKWCPSKDCEFIVERPLYSSQSVVECKCSHRFCFYCKNEDHMPASCDHVRMWNEKEQSDGENVLWMKANTKPCPNCKTRIEKNKGCNSIRCSNCKFVFCWLCGVEESKHGQNTHIS